MLSTGGQSGATDEGWGVGIREKRFIVVKSDQHQVLRALWRVAVLFSFRRSPPPAALLFADVELQRSINSLKRRSSEARESELAGDWLEKNVPPKGLKCGPRGVSRGMDRPSE